MHISQYMLTIKTFQNILYTGNIFVKLYCIVVINGYARFTPAVQIERAPYCRVMKHRRGSADVPYLILLNSQWSARQGAWYILTGVAGVARPAGAGATTAVVPSPPLHAARSPSLHLISSSVLGVGGYCILIANRCLCSLQYRPQMSPSGRGGRRHAGSSRDGASSYYTTKEFPTPTYTMVVWNNSSTLKRAKPW